MRDHYEIYLALQQQRLDDQELFIYLVAVVALLGYLGVFRWAMDRLESLTKPKEGNDAIRSSDRSK